MEFVETLLGPSFKVLLQRSARARSLNDSSYAPHRLIYIYERLKLSKKWFYSGQKEVDFLAITELQFLKNMYDRWLGTEVWDEIGNEIRQIEAYVHCILLLGWISGILDSGVRVEIVPKNKETGKRSEDARIYNNYGRYLSVELKTPATLLNPSNILNEEQAYKIVTKARKKKGSGSSKQIGASPSVLQIGGLFLRNENLKVIKLAMEENFRRNPSEHIAIMQVLTFMIEVENAEIENGGLKIDTRRSVFRPQITHWSVLNDNYKGYPPIAESNVETNYDKMNRTQVTIQGEGTGFNNVGFDI